MLVEINKGPGSIIPSAMKFFYVLICGVLLILLSCKEDRQTCESLKADLLSFNVDEVKSELNPWLGDLNPGAIEDDPLGHQQNLESFRLRLESECSLNALIVCYACIETFPVQSEIKIQMDSSGHQVHRILDIETPGNNVMTIRDIHQ